MLTSYFALRTYVRNVDDRFRPCRRGAILFRHVFLQMLVGLYPTTALERPICYPTSVGYSAILDQATHSVVRTETATLQEPAWDVMWHRTCAAVIAWGHYICWTKFEMSYTSR